MTTETTVLAHYRRLMGGRGFRLWFIAAASAGLGDWLGLFALQVLVVSLSEPGSRVALFGLGGVMLAKLLPSVLFGPLSGVVADRVNRKHLLVGANVVRVALFGVVAATREIWLLLALVFVIELMTVLFIAAKSALLPRLVDQRDLTEANQLTLLVTYGPLPFSAGVAALMSSLAAALAALGLDVEPVTAAFLLAAATFGVSAVLMLRMPVGDAGSTEAEESPSSDGGGVLGELRAGIRHVGQRPVIRALFVGVTGIFFGAGVVIALGPEFVRSDLGRPGEDWFGLMAVVGAGLLVGMGLASAAGQRLAKERVFAFVLVPAGGLVVLIAFLTSFLLTQIAGFALAVAAGTALVLGFTLLHERTPDRLRGRTFATFYTLARVAMFVALALAPFLGGALPSGTVAAGPWELDFTAVRITIGLGGLAALASAVPGFVGMLRATAGER